MLEYITCHLEVILLRNEEYPFIIVYICKMIWGSRNNSHVSTAQSFLLLYLLWNMQKIRNSVISLQEKNLDIICTDLFVIAFDDFSLAWKGSNIKK